MAMGKTAELYHMAIWASKGFTLVGSISYILIFSLFAKTA